MGEPSQESCSVKRREKDLQSFAALKGTNVAGGQCGRERAEQGEEERKNETLGRLRERGGVVDSPH